VSEVVDVLANVIGAGVIAGRPLVVQPNAHRRSADATSAAPGIPTASAGTMGCIAAGLRQRTALIAITACTVNDERQCERAALAWSLAVTPPIGAALFEWRPWRRCKHARLFTACPSNKLLPSAATVA